MIISVLGGWKTNEQPQPKNTKGPSITSAGLCLREYSISEMR